MTATLLANELSNLISEAKRKNSDLRNTADRSLQELKSLPTTSEQQLASDLSRRPTFIDPFLTACETRNARFASSGVTCLQRLVVSHGLPKTRLKETLDAFNACADLGLDVQLKVLQALPSLLQNYANELKNELLAGALQLCASLQSARAPTVSGVAAATLQQLVAAVFEKVVDEDRQAAQIPAVDEVPGDGSPVALRPAAFDAFRMFRDLVLAAEERPTKFVQLTELAPEACLELIWSALNANARLFVTHPELTAIIRSKLLPALTRPLSDKLAFSVTVRSLRIVDLLVNRYFSRFSGEFEVVLGLLSDNLDADAALPWKRVLAMELIRNFFANGGLVIEAFAAYDQVDGGKPIVQDILSAFVRLSAEKPAVIGLGQQSSVPTGYGSQKEATSEFSVEAASGMAGVISSAFGVAESSTSGISSLWSIPRNACMDQLDKAEAPILPETYVYTLVLECLNYLSDSLAKVILPLSVQREKADTATPDSSSQTRGNGMSRKPAQVSRSQSFRKRAVPANPLELETGSMDERVRAVAGLVDRCWPAVLATSSTFLNAALEEQYYRNLIKAFQRFTQVAGLLRLSTPRDALMTTLSKSAVPPHILNAAMFEHGRPLATPTTESPRVFSNPKNLLSVDSLVSQASSLTMDRERRSSIEPIRPILSTRNLLCLRALLNLAIALGPAMNAAFTVVVDALRQADMVLSSSLSQQLARQAGMQKSAESPAAVQAFSAEVAAVEAAASRLLESTVDYPNDAFITMLTAFTRLLNGKALESSSPNLRAASPPSTPTLKNRTFSGLAGISTFAEMQARDFQFVIPKLGTLSQLNTGRFVGYSPEDSGWAILVNELNKVASLATKPREARRAATDVLCKMSAEAIAEFAEACEEERSTVQRRAFAVLLQIVDSIYVEDGELTNIDLEIQSIVLAALEAILERCGESLIAGWNKIIATISTAFERTEDAETRQQHDVETQTDWANVSKDLVSVNVGRIAFHATQLVCSDFLASLPMRAMPSLVELLYRFVSQTDDLNMALTSVTAVMTVAEYLVANGAATEMDSLAAQLEDADDLVADVLSFAQASRAAQMMLLLLQLRTAVSETKKEVRNAVYQTICSVLKNHGDQLSPAAWDLVLRYFVMRIAGDDLQLYAAHDKTNGDMTAGKSAADESMSTSIIAGYSDIIAQHIGIIQQFRRMPSLWEIILTRTEAYLDCESHALNAAAYTALARILSQVDEASTAWTTPAYRAIALWLKRVPEGKEDADGREDNQSAFVAYVDTGTQLYRLAKRSMGLPQTRKLIDNVYHIISNSNGPRYSADVNTLSTLQFKALELLKTMRSDQSLLQSSLITVAARLSALHHEAVSSQSGTNGPTFIAISSDTIDWLAMLIHSHIKEAEYVDAGCVLSGVQALRRVVKSKYVAPAKCKGRSLWRKATATALDLCEETLALGHPDIDDDVTVSVWAEYVSVTAGVVHANGLDTVESREEVREDQSFDIEKFALLRGHLIPRLGSPNLPDKLRLTYCRSIFEASIVHPTMPGEVPGPEDSPLKDIQKLRRPRARRVPYSRRERMSYVCLEELIALSCLSEETIEHEKLAQAAAPFLLLRLAIPIRAYIVDQPLRGRSPQPLSELEELLYCFEQIKKLQLHPQALAADPVAADRTGSSAHLHYLYPLLAKAVATAGDSRSGAQEVLGPLQAVLESIVLVP